MVFFFFLFAGGMIQLNHGGGQPLQYVANAAFLASLYADYMYATGVPGWYCGPFFITSETIRSFATSQVLYSFIQYYKDLNSHLLEGI